MFTIEITILRIRFIALLGVCMRSRSFSVPGSPVSRFCTIYRTVRKLRFKSPVRLVHSKPRLKLANLHHTTPTAATPQLFIVAWDTRTLSGCGRFSCWAACCRPQLFCYALFCYALFACSVNFLASSMLSNQSLYMSFREVLV